MLSPALVEQFCDGGDADERGVVALALHLHRECGGAAARLDDGAPLETGTC